VASRGKLVPVTDIPSQQIRFCSSRDGTRLAYAVCGSGPPIVRSLQWGTHLELDWHTPVWRAWLGALSRGNTLIRYDSRGCGLSDRDVADLSHERHLEDLDAVVQACAPQRFALLGMTGGGPSAVTYAVRHPERVSHLVLYGTFLRGRIVRSTTPELMEETETRLRLIELGWGRDDAAYRQVYTTQFIPEATPEQFKTFNELLRRSASPANAHALLREFHRQDITALAPQVRCPTLVLHPRDDGSVPFEEGRALAAAIPDARFVSLASRNHLLLEQESAWATLLAELDAFLPHAASAGARVDDAQPHVDGLTAREHEVLELVAQGIDNRLIAKTLHLSEKTVRNNVSTLLSKLGVHTRAAAIVAARDAGLGRRTDRRQDN
jgi:pimeloyl-ACP methyl ester carboxylesterase/DNA-binding CsgD family transcriptional regulator